MKYRTIRSFFACLVAIQILFQIPAMALALDDAQPTEPMPAETTAPTEETLPMTETTAPTESQPPEPEETRSTETRPEETEAAEDQPEPETEPPETIPEEPRRDAAGPGLYFGQLHAHAGSQQTDLTEVYRSGARMGLDFFALTEHSHGLQEELWAAGRAAAASATTDRFLALYGYEIAWPRQLRLGHISAFATSGYQSWKQPEYADYETALPNYYQALTAEADSIGQFNHPGSQYGTFQNFVYSEAGDRVMTLMELDGADAWDFYLQALGEGWHLSPTGGQSARTGVYARALTEEGLCEALRNRRTYATEDADLEIMYTIDGHMMGSCLSERDLGEKMTLTVTLRDGTDSALGLAEVISTGGQLLASKTLEGSAGTAAFSLDTAPGWYLIRITQPDDDQAVTAPIWIQEAVGGLGIEALTCQTAVPEQFEEVRLTLTLYNRERSDLQVESLTFFAEDAPVASCSLETVRAGETLALPVSLEIDAVGRTCITARLTGTLDGQPQQFETALELHFRQSRQASDILVDGSHGNQGLDRLAELKQLAASRHIKMEVCGDPVTAEDLKQAGFFLITAPEEPFSPEFLALVSAYVRYGGNLLVCGQPEGNIGELNRLLESVGASLRLAAEEERGLLSAQDIDLAAPWCGGINENQYFQAEAGVSVQGGSWMVKEKHVLLAREELSGGSVLACGSLFLADDCMKPPEDLWEEPLANRTIAQAMLGIAAEALPLRTIQAARTEGSGALVRLRGYVTAGTGKSGNAFGDTICLQDETGGIWAGPISEDLLPGMAVEVTGTLTDRFLKVSTCQALDAQAFLWPPREGAWPELLDMEANGGSLIQVEGTCLEIYLPESGRLTGCLLEDGQGNKIRLRVEEFIGSGADGENDLHKFIRKGRTIRAIGILHEDEYGGRELRVRNCDEVVYVPPRNPPPFNPPTGDTAMVLPLLSLTASLLCLTHLPKRKKTSG